MASETKDKPTPPKKYYISVLRPGSDDISSKSERKGKKVAVTWLELPSIKDDEETGDLASLDVAIFEEGTGDQIDITEISRPKSNQLESRCSYKGENKGKFHTEFVNNKNGWHIIGMEYEFPAAKKA